MNNSERAVCDRAYIGTPFWGVRQEYRRKFLRLFLHLFYLH